MALLHWLGAVVVVLAVVPLRALPQAQPPAPADEPFHQSGASQGAIEGRVVDSVTGAPLPDARVTYQKNAKSGASTVADAGGHFRFQDVPPGEYTFLVSVRDHQPRHSGSNVILRHGQNVSDVTLRLVPFSSLSGQIADDDGNPLPGMEVELLRVTYLSGVRGLRVEGGWAHTDRKGSYRFRSVIPGQYYVSAFVDSAKEPDASETEQGRYIRRFYPGTFDPEAALPINLSPGVDLPNVNFRLSKTAGVRVGGIVRSSSMADIKLVPETFQFGSSFSTTTSPPDGKFEFRGVLQGMYRLQAHVKAGGQEEWAVYALAVGAGGVDRIELSPVPAPSLTAHIRVDGALSGTDLSSFLIELSPADRASGNVTFAEKADGDGTVRVANLIPGRFRLHVSNLPQGFYLKEMRSGTQEISNRVLDFTAGAALQVEAIVSRNAATVTGGVYLDDPTKAFPGAIVVLLPRETNRAEDRFAYLWTRADSAGRFAVHNVPPGEYLAYAWEDIDLADNVFMDPVFFSSVKTSGVAVSLTEGANDSIEIPVALEQ
jgi:protocatechuate 3,4-dioxygenase beta subunit